jgi:succinyl-CoA synthetase beta subunit
MAAFLEFKGSKQDEAAEQIKKLYTLFLKVDATQIEINPFGETPDGQGECTPRSLLLAGLTLSQ